MSFANFFDKTAMAASQILRGFEDSAFRRRLESCLICVSFDDSAAKSTEAKVTLELTVNLASRMYPQLQLRALGETARGQLEGLYEIARAINPAIEFCADAVQPFFCISVGESVPSVACPKIFIGSDGWIVKVASERPMGSRDSMNPFGAGAAACFGAANAFRSVFSQQLTNADLDSHFEVSLIDWDRSAAAPLNPVLNEMEIQETHLAGVGAIGNAAVWALSRVRGLRGALHLIDGEQVELSNLQRYVLAYQSDLNVEKALLGCRQFAKSNLSVVPHRKSWGEYLSLRNNWRLDSVMVAVDSATARREIQASLPRRIVNAWTQPGDIGISRHSFLGDQACLMCLYFPEGGAKNEDQLVSEAIGLPDRLMEIRTMLYTQSPLSREFMEMIATAKNIEIQRLLPFEGKPLRVLYVEGICGGKVLQMNHGSHTQQMEVPMNFQSALAGIMLGAEVVASAAGFKITPPPVTTKIDLLKSLGRHLSLPATKHRSGRCICHDPDYIAAYRNKYCLTD